MIYTTQQIGGTITVEQLLKKGIYLYLLLLLVEGALRKWLLPSLATPLLVVRDPIALVTLGMAIYHRYLYWNIYLVGTFLIGGSGIVAALLFGHGSLPVTLFGSRYLLIHFPFLFLMGALLDRNDVLRIGRFIVSCTPFMTLLIAAQFFSPQSAWINRGIGGDLAGSGFSGAMGYFRPSGIFSFTSGTTTFFSLAVVFITYFWWSSTKSCSKIVLWVATIAALIAIPLTISRAYFFQIGLTLVFATWVSLRHPAQLLRLFASALLVSVLLIAFSQLEFFQIATAAFAARFEGANAHEGGVQGVLGNRFLGELTTAILNAAEHPFWGYGLGIGTNAGQALLTGQAIPFVSTEGEWQRILSELGTFLGLGVITMRVGLGLEISLRAWHRIQLGDVLPWLLLSFGLIQITIANWAQPTSLGFSTIMGGLLLASFQHAEE
jgi:hypothetical protein